MTRLVNLALYQSGWFACTLGAAHGRPGTGAVAALALVGVHLVLARRPADELLLLAAAALLGAVVESAQVYLGLLRFASGYAVDGLAPPWIVVMWIQFATLFRYALSWLSGRFALAAVLGALGGPLAFWAGARLGAVTLHPELYPSAVSLAVVWSCAVPALLWISDRTADRPGRGKYRGLD